MDDVINFKIYLQSSSKAKAGSEKRGEHENTKIWVYILGDKKREGNMKIPKYEYISLGTKKAS